MEHTFGFAAAAMSQPPVAHKVMVLLQVLELTPTSQQRA